MFHHIIGNDQIKVYLQRMVEKETIGNSLLFAGPDGVGKSLFAKAFAKLLINDPRVDSDTHPDVRHYYPEGKIGMHTIESMRRFTEEVYLSPFEAKWKIFIVHDAERMLTYSANALLKTFEEPADDTIIILISSSPNKLIPTVLSRCQNVHFHQIAKEDLSKYIQENWKLEEDQSVQIASRAQGSFGLAHRLMQEEGQTREIAIRMLSQGKISYGDLSDHVKLICDQVEEAQGHLADSIREDVKKAYQSDMSAHQKQVLEKEVDGAVAMRLAEESEELFEIILGWYRDLELMKVGGNLDLLMHGDHRKELEASFQRGEFRPLEQLHQLIAEAKLALARSTSLSIVLENLFLKFQVAE